MSQLIALIIAIALGAIVTAIGYVLLGDAFTKNSERGVALQFVTQASQLEMAMTAYRAENAKSAMATTGNFTTAVTETLVAEDYLKSGLIAPQGAYSLELAGGDVFLISKKDTDNTLSVAVCQEINKIANGEKASITPTATVTDGASAKIALNAAKLRFACFGTTADTSIFAYEVE